VPRIEIRLSARLPKANGTASANLARTTFKTPKSALKRNSFANEHFSAARYTLTGRELFGQNRLAQAPVDFIHSSPPVDLR
jgi:hypothetical protein